MPVTVLLVKYTIISGLGRGMLPNFSLDPYSFRFSLVTICGMPFKVLRNILSFSSFALCLVLASCFGPDIPDGRILVQNTSQDREYNIVRVSAKGRSYSLAPGDSTLLPRGSTLISFSRRYEDHTKRYTVQCPRDFDDGILIKLIDVHLNKMGGGCTTVSASK